MSRTPSVAKALPHILLAVLMGLTAALCLFALACPLIVAVMGWKSGNPAAVLAVGFLPWWVRFVMERLYRLRVLSAVSYGRIPVPGDASVTRRPEP